METKDYIQKFKKGAVIDGLKYEVVEKRYKVAGEPLVVCRDAILKSRKYSGIKVSDIVIFDPSYLAYLQKNHFVDEELKTIISEIIAHQEIGMDDIRTSIALGEE